MQKKGNFMRGVFINFCAAVMLSSVSHGGIESLVEFVKECDDETGTIQVIAWQVMGDIKQKKSPSVLKEIVKKQLTLCPLFLEEVGEEVVKEGLSLFEEYAKNPRLHQLSAIGSGMLGDTNVPKEDKLNMIRLFLGCVISLDGDDSEYEESSTQESSGHKEPSTHEETSAHKNSECILTSSQSSSSRVSAGTSSRQ